MRDTIELEHRGVPVALITATGRLVEVRKRAGIFEISHAFADKIAATMGSVWATAQLSKFGYHQALRLAGCRGGDAVRLGEVVMDWEYPDAVFERAHRPAGFGRWNTDVDGFKRFESVVTPDPVPGLTAAAVAERAGEITPKVVRILTG